MYSGSSNKSYNEEFLVGFVSIIFLENCESSTIGASTKYLPWRDLHVEESLAGYGGMTHSAVGGTNFSQF